MTETSPTTGPGTVPAGGGTELHALPDLTRTQIVDLDNPQLTHALDRVRKALNDPDGVISAFQSFTS